MKRKMVYAVSGLVIVVGGYIAFGEIKDRVVDWYAHHIMERTTRFPATEQPDQVCLSWSADPRTSQAIQWRTSTSVADGLVEYREKGVENATVERVPATRFLLEDPLLVNNPKVNRFTVELYGLKPGTTYEYRVGAKGETLWNDWSEFTTAPDSPVPFRFVYMGDPQKGLDEWGKLLQIADQSTEKEAFYVIAGDLVNSGSSRDEWDEFFAGAGPVFGRYPIVPTLGNHDYDKDEQPQMYLDTFALLENGPKGFPKERAYSFTYGNALFVVLDTNISAQDQTEWLEKTLRESKETWKFAIYHHPAYPSSPNRDGEPVLSQWTPLFDKYHVDMALQGHDHAYLRTFPMKGGKKVDSAKEGTYYVITVSGTKFYKQGQYDYAEVAFPDTMTYQTIDIDLNPDRLTYRAYDFDGKMRDEIVIQK